jgi:hypothetical protein
MRIDSFITGMAALFLQHRLFFHSKVLRGFEEETLDRMKVCLGYGLKLNATDIESDPDPLFSSTRDGATAAAFHAHCDGQGPTMVLIKDTEGNVFGGYTSVNWSSEFIGYGVSDPSAFLISIVNPYGDAPFICPSVGNNRSTMCYPCWGPWFGCGICVTGAFDGQSYTYVDGRQYLNPTDRPAHKVLTARECFTPCEVEVFRVLRS